MIEWEDIVEIGGNDYHSWVKCEDGMIWCSCYSGQRIF